MWMLVKPLLSDCTNLCDGPRVAALPVAGGLELGDL